MRTTKKRLSQIALETAVKDALRDSGITLAETSIPNEVRSLVKTKSGIVVVSANGLVKAKPRRTKRTSVYHGGKVGKAGKTLASKGSSKSAKSNAGKTLANHKAKMH